MKLMKMPNGLSAVGYGDEDIAALVRGTMPQHRVTKLSPRSRAYFHLTPNIKNMLTPKSTGTQSGSSDHVKACWYLLAR